MPTTDGTGLIGRHRETALLRSAVHDVLSGAGGGTAILLRGEASIGKTVLLDWVRTEARRRGCTTLRAVGCETEEGQAFGALHQVLGPLMERPSPAVSRHRREALESALGLRDAQPQSSFMIGAAALALLAEASRIRPVVLLLDDVQWIDTSSAAVFSFLCRRLAGLPMVIVSAGRPGARRPMAGRRGSWRSRS
ncbi:ATP-binding protein [Streptomyces gibsoniae]|uniref:ATP-binding protein n=1 Tax=Streptomyces gibsoniae TaxID=3075529 RepID=A0ABU2U4I6_9ACTN|nr:ATP-binding protein [Streptomyces sp. DSM 41699]MDT0468141.1 ATP-binding protein [Streptomyces sp. DSM 41699]